MTIAEPVFVAGGAGFVGRALLAALRRGGHAVLAPTRAELDLRERAAVDAWFARNRPASVVMLAGKVGGISANLADPVGFLSDNARILLNLFESSAAHGVKRCLMVASSTIYPAECPQPMREEHLLTGSPERSTLPFALSKIVGIELARACRTQHGLDTICPVLCNIYGDDDHFEPERSTVLAALVRRFVEAREEGAPEVVCWGSGRARRELLHVDDLADALVLLLDVPAGPELVNVGSGTDTSIAELAELVRVESRYTGKVTWDASKPEGMLRKCMDPTRLRALGFMPKIALREGIARAIRGYEAARARSATRG